MYTLYISLLYIRCISDYIILCVYVMYTSYIILYSILYVQLYTNRRCIVCILLGRWS